MAIDVSCFLPDALIHFDMGFFLTLVIALVLFGIVMCFLLMLYQDENHNSNRGNKGGEDDDDQGGNPWDIDAPLDLPPGVYVMPPETVNT